MRNINLSGSRVPTADPHEPTVDPALIAAAFTETEAAGGIPLWVIEDMVLIARLEFEGPMDYYSPEQYDSLATLVAFLLDNDIMEDDILDFAQLGFGIGLTVNWDAVRPPKR
jgi:hypothetical protein